MNARLVFIFTDSSTTESYKPLSFTFRKSSYLPYTQMKARAVIGTTELMSVSEVKLFVNDKLVHYGLIDTLSVSKVNGDSIVNVTSRSFTSLLCQNQIEPGMKTGVSINDLMDSFYDFPHVTHENNSDTSSYIFVKNNSTMWDALVNLSYKLCGTYPYIRGTNCINITAVSSPTRFTFADSEITETGTELDLRNTASDFHMSDINGEFGSYELTDTSIAARSIVRHKFFELDKQFLSDPQSALVYRDKYRCRALRRRFIRYCGYRGEDLSDSVTFGSVVGRRIDSVEINGSDKGIFTKLSVYYDKFYL